MKWNTPPPHTHTYTSSKNSKYCIYSFKYCSFQKFADTCLLFHWRVQSQCVCAPKVSSFHITLVPYWQNSWLASELVTVSQNQAVSCWAVSNNNFIQSDNHLVSKMSENCQKNHNFLKSKETTCLANTQKTDFQFAISWDKEHDVTVEKLKLGNVWLFCS